MALADPKIVQSFVNRLAWSISVIRTEITAMKAVRDDFNVSNPSTTGTCAQGVKASWNSALDQLDQAVNGTAALTRTTGSKTDWDQIEACLVPSHRGEAL